MRVLLSTFGSRGDLQPIAALAAALKTIGADPIVVAPPDEQNVRLLERIGVPLAPTSTPVRQWMNELPKRKAGIPELAAEIMRDGFEVISKAAAACDVLLAAELFPFTAAARSVAEKLAIPYVYATFCPLWLPSTHHRPFAFPGRPHPPKVTDNSILWERDAATMDALFGPALNVNRSSIGLPPVHGVRDYVFTDRPWLASDPVLSPWVPTQLSDVVQTGAWILADTRPLPPEIEQFLSTGSPPVYVGFGSMTAPTSGDAARVAIEALRAQGRRVLLSRGWAGLAPLDGSSDCLGIGEVNQQALFTRVAAVVHHGGAGTTVSAARAGAPQLVIPQIGDQPYWARRVLELGIGAAPEGPSPSLDVLSAALESTLAAETHTRAVAVAAQVRTDGAEVAARLLLDMASSKRSGHTGARRELGES